MEEQRDGDRHTPTRARTTRRRGRLSTTVRDALTDLAPRWTLPPGPWNRDLLDAEFGRRSPRLLDVGGGTGEATLAWARDHPDWDVVAVELHRPGIGQLVRTIDEQGPTTIRVVEADVVRLVPGGIEPATFDAIRVLFPDPWPKRRHLERRLLDAGFARQLADLLAPGGWLHVATDWDDYADQIRAALAAEPRLRRAAGATPVDDEGRWWSPRPDRPITAYEQRGIDAGRSITDLVVARVT